MTTEHPLLLLARLKEHLGSMTRCRRYWTQRTTSVLVSAGSIESAFDEGEGNLS